MTFDDFHKKVYDEKSYNCAHFSADVWKHLTGQDIASELNGFLLPPDERFGGFELRSSFEKVKKPIDPCLVLMTRPRFAPHAGVYTERKVIHIWRNGVHFLPVDAVIQGFSKVSYYVAKKDKLLS